MTPFNYVVTLTKPAEGRIFSENFNWYDYATPSDMRQAFVKYCNESIRLGWDVMALDDNSKIVFISKSEK